MNVNEFKKKDMNESKKSNKGRMNADEYVSNKKEEWTSLKSNKKDKCEQVK